MLTAPLDPGPAQQRRPTAQRDWSRTIVATPEGERELLFIGRLTVGRAPECDISLADNKASRHHAEFEGVADPADRHV